MNEKLYLELLKNINELVENDFCSEMNVVDFLNEREFTQGEAKYMSKILAEVHRNSHQIHCEECRNIK